MNTATLSSDLPAAKQPLASAWVRLFLVALTAVGIPALIYRLYAGLNVTALGSVVPWGVWVAFYIYFIGLSAGSFLLSTLIFVFKNEKLEPVGRLAVVQAFACLITGLVFIFLDLGHWERFWHVMVYPQWGSVLAWEIWFYNAYIVVLLAELWLLMRCDLARWARETRGPLRPVYRLLSFGFKCPANAEAKAVCDARTKKLLTAFGIIGIPIALGVHGGTGAIFAVVKARPGWYSAIFPLIFVVSALVSGGGLLLFLRAFMSPDPREDREVLPMLAKLTGGFLVFDVLLMGLEFLVGLYGAIPEHHHVFQLMLFGPFWYIFWGLQLGIGTLLPLLLVFVRSARAGTVRLGLAGLCIFLGVFGVRLNIVIPALAVPVLPGFDHAVDSVRLASLYVPNWIEWLSSFGVIGAAALITNFVMYLLPMREHQPAPNR